MASGRSARTQRRASAVIARHQRTIAGERGMKILTQDEWRALAEKERFLGELRRAYSHMLTHFEATVRYCAQQEQELRDAGLRDNGRHSGLILPGAAKPESAALQFPNPDGDPTLTDPLAATVYIPMNRLAEVEDPKSAPFLDTGWDQSRHPARLMLRVRLVPVVAIAHADGSLGEEKAAGSLLQGGEPGDTLYRDNPKAARRAMRDGDDGQEEEESGGEAETPPGTAVGVAP